MAVAVETGMGRLRQGTERQVERGWQRSPVRFSAVPVGFSGSLPVDVELPVAGGFSPDLQQMDRKSFAAAVERVRQGVEVEVVE